MQGGKVVVPLNSCRRPALLVAPGAHRSALLRTWSASGSRQRGGRCLPPLPETAPALDTGPGSDPDCVRFIRVALGSGLRVWKVGSSFLLLRGAMGDSAWHRPGPGGSLAHVGLQGSAFLPRAQWPWDSRGPFSWSRGSGPHPARSGLDPVSALPDASPAVAGLVVPCWAQETRPGRAV